MNKILGQKLLKRRNIKVCQLSDFFSGFFLSVEDAELGGRRPLCGLREDGVPRRGGPV